MPTYQIELEDGRQFELELDQAVPEGAAGQELLQQLIGDQLAAAEAES